MFILAIICLTLLLLVGVLGRPYSQTWYGRWNR